VLLPGDPLRARHIAERCFDGAELVNEVRGALAYTGTYQGMPVSVLGTGMGIPSASIYATELVREYGVTRLVRVGSCGALQEHLALRDVVLAVGACTDSGVNRARYGGMDFAATADFALLRAAAEAAEAREQQVAVGNVHSADLFYDPREGIFDLQRGMGVLAVEMEAAGLYGVAAAHGVRALTVLTVSDHILHRRGGLRRRPPAHLRRHGRHRAGWPPSATPPGSAADQRQLQDQPGEDHRQQDPGTGEVATDHLGLASARTGRRGADGRDRRGERVADVAAGGLARQQDRRQDPSAPATSACSEENSALEAVVEPVSTVPKVPSGAETATNAIPRGRPAPRRWPRSCRPRSGAAASTVSPRMLAPTLRLRTTQLASAAGSPPAATSPGAGRRRPRPRRQQHVGQRVQQRPEHRGSVRPRRR
jgi:purine-nucleoside phosphorylase